MSDILSAALDLAASGWAVFPCKWHVYGDDAKAPLTHRGHHEATRDPDVIRSWWRRWPLAMIGAPVPDSLLVVDIDPRNGGSIDSLAGAAGPVPDTLTAWSGRNDGGRHLYFLRPPGQLTSTRLPVGIDLKVNGYCIVPPSLHPATLAPYRWDHRPAAELPPGLRSLLRPPPAPKTVRVFARAGSGKALISWVAARSTNVNDAVYWAAKRAAREGILDDIEAGLVAAADAAARSAGTWSSTGERQTRNTIRSARMWVAREGVAR